MLFFFFFQAEDGIRDVAVTGVQTCALPILNTPENSTSMAFQTSGFNNVKYLVATRSDTPNHGDNRLTLEFAGARVGIPSWLAEPAPMGSLDYVSANAEAAVSLVAKQPALMFDDLLSVLSSDPHFSSNLAEMRSEEHTSELQSRLHLVCRLLLEKKKNTQQQTTRLNRS